MSDITSQNLTELIKNIKDKKISSEEVTKSFVEKAEKARTLNCYITEDFDSAIILIIGITFPTIIATRCLMLPSLLCRQDTEGYCC